MVAALQRFFGSWRFPLVGLTVGIATTALGAATLFWPPAPDALGQFAEDFRVWCFGYDPATGTIEWGYVGVFLVQPLVLCGIFAALWAGDLRRLRAREAAPWLGLGLVVTVFVAAGLWASFEPSPRGELPFPAEELRTSTDAPRFSLDAHDGTVVDLAGLRGKVVMVTGVYASCGNTCPMIMAQSRDAVAALTPAEREDVRVVAVTLDPAHDTPAVLAAMAEAQQVSAPTFRLLTGPVPAVEGALDAFGIERKRDHETGVITHGNVFALIDREGRVAYRFSLGERQKAWLASALRLLVSEGGGAS